MTRHAEQVSATRKSGDAVLSLRQTAQGDAGATHRSGLTVGSHGRSAPCAASHRTEGGLPACLLRGPRLAENLSVLLEEILQCLPQVDRLGHTSDLRESAELLDDIRIVVGRDLLLFPLVFAHHKKIPINCLLLLAVAGSISYMKSPKDATMSKPRIAILTLVALATFVLAACSHPSSQVAQRKAQQKAVESWLSTPSWTPRQCAAPCGAPPPPPQAAPHRQH